MSLDIHDSEDVLIIPVRATLLWRKVFSRTGFNPSYGFTHSIPKISQHTRGLLRRIATFHIHPPHVFWCNQWLIIGSFPLNKQFFEVLRQITGCLSQRKFLLYHRIGRMTGSNCPSKSSPSKYSAYISHRLRSPLPPLEILYTDHTQLSECRT